jgi:hypothetical protein
MKITGSLAFHTDDETEFWMKVAAWVGYMRAKGYDVDEVTVTIERETE